MNQLSFLPKISLEHGGDLRRGKRKTARPLDPKRPIHLVMRSSQTKGIKSLLLPKIARKIEKLVSEKSKKYSIRVYRLTNSGNHLHLIIKIKDRKSFQNFIREFAGMIAMQMTGAKKGLQKKFWDSTAYTRLLTWGREFKTVMNYLLQNAFEVRDGYHRYLGYRLIELRRDD